MSIFRYEDAYIVEDVKIRGQGVASTGISAIIRNLDSVIERIQIVTVDNGGHVVESNRSPGRDSKWEVGKLEHRESEALKCV